MSRKNVLVTGGAGYIGSHMVRTLLEAKYTPVVFDNLSTGHRHFVPKGVAFFKGDLRNREDVRRALKKYPIDTVMDFAASIVVPESVQNPLKYYENNVLSSINLLNGVVEGGIERFIFSSTAAVYGEPKVVPVREDAQTLPANPYGGSKLMVEEILKNSAAAYPLRYVSLRYFNVAGSHPSAEIGIDYETVTHLIPSILKVATGERKEFQIFGDDHATKDGTCIRDFIYVLDLCDAHLRALEYLRRGGKSNVFNLGNGNGFSVKQVLDAAEKVTGIRIAVKVAPRRAGDPAKVVASSDKAKKILKWKPKADLALIIETAWKWEQAQARRGKTGKKS